jgi:hypothetical protein
MKEGAAGVSKKSHVGDDRGIPPLAKNARSGPPDGYFEPRYLFS